MRRTSGSGCGPEEVEGAGLSCRRPGSGSDAMKGATWAMPIRQATRSADERSANGTATSSAAVASRPARVGHGRYARSGGRERRASHWP